MLNTSVGTSSTGFQPLLGAQGLLPIRAGQLLNMSQLKNIVRRIQGITKLVEIQTGKVEEKLARVSLLQTLVAKTSEAEKG